MLFQLGTYKFEGLKLPQSWGANYATEYAQIPIIGGKPVVQMTGEKLVEHDITALFSDEFCKPKDEIEALQVYRRNGNVLLLSGGDGTNYGQYVITDINIVNTRAYDDSGYISAISATIKLLEYNSTEAIVPIDGKALTSNKPAPMIPLTPIDTPPVSISNNLSVATLKSRSISNNTKSNVTKYSKIVSLCDEANAAWTSANDKIQDTKKIIRRALELQNSITDAKNAVAAVKAASQARDLNALYAANTQLEQAVYFTNGAGVPVAAFVGSKEGGS